MADAPCRQCRFSFFVAGHPWRQFRPAPRPLAVAIAGALLVLGSPPVSAQQSGGDQPSVSQDQPLAPVQVRGDAGELAMPTPPDYAGGQVASGAEIGVLGNKDIMDTPFNFTSYTDALIENQQAQTLGDAVKNDSSVQVSNGYGNQAETFVVRGFPLYGDDISFNGLYGVLPRQIVPLQMAERLDIFKGPSAFLNGVPPAGSGVGGTINLQPKRAGQDPLTRLTVDYTSDHQVGGAIDLGRRFGAEKRFGVRLNAATRNGETSIDDEQRKFDFASLGLDYLGERLRASFDFGYQKVRFDQPRPTVQLTGSGVPDAPKGTRNYGQPYSYSDLETTFAMGKVEYDFNDNLMGYVALGGNDNNEHGTYTTMQADENGIGRPGWMAVPYLSETVSGETGLRGLFDTGGISHQVNLSLSSLRTKKRSAYEMGDGTPGDTSLYNPIDYGKTPPSFAGGDMSSPGVTERKVLSGVALSDTLGFFDERVQLTVGGRFQQLHTKAYDYDRQRSSQYKKNTVSPVYAILFKATDSISLYANHIEGVTERPVASGQVSNIGETFPPSESEQNEIGVKYDAYSYGASLAVFQIKQPSPTGYTRELDDGTSVFELQGEQKNRGVELNVYGQPLSGLRLLGGATYIDSELQETAEPADEGNRATGVPAYQFTAGLEWDLPGVTGTTLLANAQHTAKQYVDPANSQHIPDWTRVDLGARYTTRVDNHPVTLRAGVENVFDEDYWASANGGYLTQGYPRLFKLSVSVDL